MEYDKEFEEWFGSWWISGDFGSTRLAKDAAWYAWQAARENHYRIGEEVENILTGERAEVKAVLSFTDSITHINPTNVRRIPAWVPKEGEAVFLFTGHEQCVHVGKFVDCEKDGRYKVITQSGGCASITPSCIKPFSAEKIGKPWEEI